MRSLAICEDDVLFELMRTLAISPEQVFFLAGEAKAAKRIRKLGWIGRSAVLIAKEGNGQEH